MFKAFRWKPTYGRLSEVAVCPQFNFLRGMHSRTKKAMEFIAKGYSALEEVERVIDYCDRNDTRLIPLLRGFKSSRNIVIFPYFRCLDPWTLSQLIGFGVSICLYSHPIIAAKEKFELALEADNTNTQARYWLSTVHFKYNFCPGANKAVGAALLVEAAEMGNPDAQYYLGCQLRAENPYVQSEQQAFYYLEKAVDQLHPGALYLLGAVYLTGDCVKQDVSSAIWCFHRASKKGHAASAIAYGSLLLAGVELPESVTKFNVKKASNRKLRNDSGADDRSPVEMAREQFEIAANAGSDLGLKWLNLLDKEQKKKGASSS